MWRISMWIASTLMASATIGCSSDPEAPNENATAKGLVTLTVRINGTQTNDGGDETVSMNGTANYKFDLTEAEVSEESGERMVTWDDERLTGIMTWAVDRQRTYQCNSAIVTDRTLVNRNASPSLSDGQIAGGTLIIDPSGKYQLVVSATPVGTPDSEVTETWMNCPPVSYDRLETPLPVPFLQYFIPMNPTMMGMYSGTILSSNPSSVKGSYSGTDSIAVFSSGTDSKYIEVDYTVSWDITISN